MHSVQIKGDIWGVYITCSYVHAQQSRVLQIQMWHKFTSYDHF